LRPVGHDDQAVGLEQLDGTLAGPGRRRPGILRQLSILSVAMQTLIPTDDERESAGSSSRLLGRGGGRNCTFASISHQALVSAQCADLERWEPSEDFV
jgi:hypothetical protein